MEAVKDLEELLDEVGLAVAMEDPFAFAEVCWKEWGEVAEAAGEASTRAQVFIDELQAELEKLKTEKPQDLADSVDIPRNLFEMPQDELDKLRALLRSSEDARQALRIDLGEARGEIGFLENVIEQKAGALWWKKREKEYREAWDAEKREEEKGNGHGT